MAGPAGGAPSYLYQWQSSANPGGPWTNIPIGGTGKDYIIPKPFDPRLIAQIAPAVAKAAMDSGVATRPIEDFGAYRDRLNQWVYQSGQIMRPVFAAAKQAPKRVVYAEGEEERMLRAAQLAVDEGIARPVLVGRPDVITSRIERLGLRLKRDKDFDLVDPGSDARYREYWGEYYRLTKRKGVSQELAKLDALCVFGCVEQRTLKQAIADQKAGKKTN